MSFPGCSIAHMVPGGITHLGSRRWRSALVIPFGLARLAAKQIEKVSPFTMPNITRREPSSGPAVFLTDGSREVSWQSAGDGERTVQREGRDARVCSRRDRRREDLGPRRVTGLTGRGTGHGPTRLGVEVPRADDSRMARGVEPRVGRRPTEGGAAKVTSRASPPPPRERHQRNGTEGGSSKESVPGGDEARGSRPGREVVGGGEGGDEPRRRVPRSRRVSRGLGATRRSALRSSR